MQPRSAFSAATASTPLPVVPVTKPKAYRPAGLAPAKLPPVPPPYDRADPCH